MSERKGNPFAIGSDFPLVDGDIYAFDGDVRTTWTALCPDIPNSKAHEIWGDLVAAGRLGFCSHRVFWLWLCSEAK